MIIEFEFGGMVSHVDDDRHNMCNVPDLKGKCFAVESMLATSLAHDP